MIDGMMELTTEVVDRLGIEVEHEEHLMMLEALISLFGVEV